MIHDNWTFFQGALAVSLAYVTGQIVAMPSSIILEHWLARKLLRPPAVVLLSATTNGIEHFISRFLLGRHYAPFPQGTRDKILTNAEKQTGLSRVQLCGAISNGISSHAPDHTFMFGLGYTF